MFEQGSGDVKRNFDSISVRLRSQMHTISCSRKNAGINLLWRRILMCGGGDNLLWRMIPMGGGNLLWRMIPPGGVDCCGGGSLWGVNLPWRRIPMGDILL